MTKRLLPVLLAGLVCLAGMVLADEPAGPDEPPVRLKKKKPRGEDKPKTEPNKPDEKKKDDNKKEQPKAEPREAEPVTPQEEDKEVLQRVVKNAQTVEDRLAKNDLGEGTLQTQRDMLKDIESLIHRSENPPPQSGGQQEPNNGGGGGDDQEPMDNKDQQAGEEAVNSPRISRALGAGHSRGGARATAERLVVNRARAAPAAERPRLVRVRTRSPAASKAARNPVVPNPAATSPVRKATPARATAARSRVAATARAATAAEAATATTTSATATPTCTRTSGAICPKRSAPGWTPTRTRNRSCRSMMI